MISISKTVPSTPTTRARGVCRWIDHPIEAILHHAPPTWAKEENETARYLPLFVTIRVPHVVFPVTFVDVGTNNESREALSPASLTYAASMTADNHLNLPLYRASTVVPSLKGSTLPVAVLVVKPM